jgi:hypothetical protein
MASALLLCAIASWSSMAANSNFHNIMPFLRCQSFLEE